MKDSAFGKNDIRGIFGDDITEELFFFVGKGYVKYLISKTSLPATEIWITVAKDARISSPTLAKALINGVISTGANVIDLGLAPTPIGYYSEAVGVNAMVTEDHDITGALIVTASHNPSQYNGLKMTYNKQTLNEAQIKEVKEFTLKEYELRAMSSAIGKYKEYDLIPDYISAMKKQFGRIGEGIKVVIDSANATGGVVAPKLYRDLGCEVVELYSNPDGRFPHHHPNPSEESTLKDLKLAVLKNRADLGIAFDGDADRIGVIDSRGNSLPGDLLMLLYALEIIESYRLTKTKPVVVAEVKCSQLLFDTINAKGAKAVMCKTGHGFIKDKMKELGAHFGGEMSGHTFFKDRYYGFDDAIYAGCRMIEIIAKHKKEDPTFRVEKLLEQFGTLCASRELRLPCPNELKAPTLENFEKYVKEIPDMFGDKIKEIITIDGMRIVFDGGFALIRQSNTEPVFTIRFEGKTPEKCKMYEEAMLKAIEICRAACEK